VFREILEPKKGEVSKQFIRPILRHREHLYLYRQTGTVRTVNWWRLQWADHVLGIGRQEMHKES
jgi:hypothetical protein